jgi:hypothetical protein
MICESLLILLKSLQKLFKTAIIISYWCYWHVSSQFITIFQLVISFYLKISRIMNLDESSNIYRDILLKSTKVSHNLQV